MVEVLGHEGYHNHINIGNSCEAEGDFDYLLKRKAQMESPATLQCGPQNWSERMELMLRLI
jgi:hypothetical protein